MSDRKHISREEFERYYAERCGVTQGDLPKVGLEAVPCDCGAPFCKGWQMATRSVQAMETFRAGHAGGRR
jgi:hypothetical protein